MRLIKQTLGYALLSLSVPCFMFVFTLVVLIIFPAEDKLEVLHLQDSATFKYAEIPLNDVVAVTIGDNDVVDVYFPEGCLLAKGATLNLRQMSTIDGFNSDPEGYSVYQVSQHGAIAGDNGCAEDVFYIVDDSWLLVDLFSYWYELEVMSSFAQDGIDVELDDLSISIVDDMFINDFNRVDLY
ncbi:hypothetical protein VCHA53O466_40177 [Vibrio chagasii]|nr:hypothetical protein VCHA53O466_40177 [Vibrio chagasii]